MQVVTKVQNNTWLMGYAAVLSGRAGAVRGGVKRIRMAANIAITPPSLFGIDRRIA